MPTHVRLHIALMAIAVIASLPVYSYRWHLLLHIFEAVVFLGNIMVTAAWMVLAERTREPSVMRFASRTVNRADLLFTGPAVILVLLNGLTMAARRWGGWSGFYETSWITAALILFAASRIVWVGFLLRYQFRLIRVSTASNDSVEQLPGEFFDVLHRWYAWGSLATVLPLVSLYLMVTKPELW